MANAELGKAYVQIIPSATGITGQITNLLGGDASSAGQAVGGMLGKSIVSSVTGIIAAAGIGKLVTDTITTGMDFDKSMSQVAATMGTTVDQIQNLSDFAQEMGASTAFSATEAADALNYMALAGYDAETSMNMLPNVLNLAAAGQIDLARASDMVTDAQTALGLSLDETSVMVDEMAKTASKSNTSVAQLGDAFLQIGANARNIKGGTSELSTVLGVLADNGIKGAEAGTHLRNIMLALNPQTDRAVKAWDALGVSAYDAEGNLRALPDVFADLNQAMQGMTEQQKTEMFSAMFNKTDLASIQALVGTTTQRFGELSAEIENAKGAAEQMANTQLDNLAGSITLAKSAFEGLQIAIAEGVAPAMQGLVNDGAGFMQSLTQAINAGNMEATFAIIKNGITNSIKNAFNNAIAGINFVADNADMIVNAGLELTSALALAIMQAAPALVTAAMNLMIAFGNALISYDWAALGAQFMTAIQSMIPEGTATEIMQPIYDGITAALPGLLNAGIQIITNLANGILANLPTLMLTAGQLVIQFVGFILQNLPTILVAAADLVVALATGIINNLPQLVATAAQLIMEFRGTIISNLPQILAAGVQVIIKLIAGIKQSVAGLYSAAVEICKRVANSFIKYDWIGLGKNIIDGIIKGVQSAGDALITSILSMCQGAFTAVKNFFGISSPSKLMAKDVGRHIPEGIAVGIEKNAKVVDDAVRSMVSDATDTSILSDVSFGTASFNTSTEDSKVLARMDAMLTLMSRYFPEMATNSGEISIASINRQLGAAYQ